MDRFYDEDPENEKPFFGNNDPDDDDEDDDDDDFYDLEEETIAFIQKPDLVQVMQVSIARDELKHELLDKAIDVAKSNWFWRFKSAATKAKEVTLIYENFALLIKDSSDDESDEK